MTKRSVVLGLLMSCLIGYMGYFCMVMRQDFLFGNYLTVFVFGILMLLILVNPLLCRIWPGLGFSGRELAVIVAICLPSSYVTSRSLVRHLPVVLVRPHLLNKTIPAWRKRQVIRRTPTRMLANVLPEYEPEDILKPEDLNKALGVEQDREGLAKLLNARLDETGLVDSLPEDARLPDQAQEIAKDGPRNAEELRILNRHVLDITYGESVRSHESKMAFVVDAFHSGLQKGAKHITLRDVPWYGWKRTLLTFWGPLIMCLCCAFIGLALVVKRQWAECEHLPFPIAEFAQTILPGDDKKMSSIFRNRAFWIGVGLVVFYHMNNYAARWFPDVLVPINIQINMVPFARLIPAFDRCSQLWAFNPPIVFTFIGFAYLVSRDVSLSVGLAPFVYGFVSGTLLGYGIVLDGGGDYNSLRPNNFIKAGAYFAMFLVVVYTGRRHYLCVARRFFGLKSPDEVQPHELFGARMFVVGSVLFIVQLCIIGVEWQWAIMHTAISLIVYVAVSRMVCEAGVVIVQPMIIPVTIIWGMFGARCLGIEQMLLLMLVGAVIDFGCQLNVMPQLLTGLRMTNVKPSRIGSLASTGVLFALVLGIVTALYFQYDRGFNAGDGAAWGTRLSHRAYMHTVRVEGQLEAQGTLKEAKQPSVFKRTSGFSPTKKVVVCFIVAMSLVLLLEFFRLRIPKWPFHPVMILLAGFPHAQYMAGSFLIGCLIKTLVTKYGGIRFYRSLKPAMIGLIAGDIIAALICTIIGTIYFLVKNQAPVNYWWAM